MDDWFIFFSLIVLSAIFSGSETAFLTFQKAKAFVWRHQKRRFSRLLVRYVRRPERYLIVTLIGNNLVNIAYTSIGTLLFIEFMDEDEIVLSLTFIILIFSEISPKALFATISDSAIRIMSTFIRLVEYITYPLTAFAAFVSRLLIGQSNDKETIEHVFSEHELNHIFQEATTGGEVHTEEHKYIKNTFLLNHTKVKEIMIPRTDIIGVDQRSTIPELLSVMRDHGLSKCPVYNDSIDQIVGFVFSKDLLDGPESLEMVLKPALMVTEQKSCMELLVEFRKQHRTVAIAVDEYGGVSGLITIEKVLEVIVGDIPDELEKNRISALIIQVNKNVYKVAGRTEKEDVESTLGVMLPEGDFETIAGMILSEIGRVPRKNEKISFADFSVKIISADPRRIDWMLVTKL